MVVVALKRDRYVRWRTEIPRTSVLMPVYRETRFVPIIRTIYPNKNGYCAQATTIMLHLVFPYAMLQANE